MELKNQEMYEVYPNPFVDHLHLRLKENQLHKNLTVYNNLGQKVFEKKIDNLLLSFNLGFLPHGSYHIVIDKNPFSKSIYK